MKGEIWNLDGLKISLNTKGTACPRGHRRKVIFVEDEKKKHKQVEV